MNYKILRRNLYIKEKKLGGDLVSYRHTNKIHNNQEKWEIAKKGTAAGTIFLHTKKGIIVARGFNRFFNIGEMPETSWSALKESLVFPIDVFVKENGFLGLVSWDKQEQKLFISSKTVVRGDFARWFEGVLRKTVDMEKLEEYVKEYDVTFAFEVIDVVNDPHIVEYQESKVVLLDIIKNQEEECCVDYAALRSVAGKIGAKCKKLYVTLDNWREFVEFVDKAKKIEGLEGFVTVDKNGYRLKIKTDWYLRWRRIRSLIAKKSEDIKLDAIENKEMKEFLNWFITNRERIENGVTNRGKSLIYYRNMWEEEKNDK